MNGISVILQHPRPAPCSVHYSVSPTSPVSRQHVTSRMNTYAMPGLISRHQLSPLEIPALGMEACESVTSFCEARLASPFASALALTRVPACIHADRPLEVELSLVGLGTGADEAVYIASWISAHARLTMYVDVAGQPRVEDSFPVAVRLCSGGWIARALVRPASWADAASVTVLSLSLAGRPLPSLHDCLPATLRVGYNHASAPAGAVHAAAKAGDVLALQAALDAGESTNEVCGVLLNGKGLRDDASKLPPFSAAAWQDCSLLGRPQRPP